MSWGRSRRGGGLEPIWRALDGIPGVRAILVTCVASLLVFALVPGSQAWISRNLGFTCIPGSLNQLLTRPWGLLTHVFVQPEPLALVFNGFALWVVGGYLERAWGTRVFLAVSAALAVVSGLAATLVGSLVGLPVAVFGLWYLLDGLFVAWAALDPDLELQMVLGGRIKLKVIAAIYVVLTFVNVAVAHPTLGPVLASFTLAAPAAAWLYVRKMRGSRFGRRDVAFRPRRKVGPERPWRPNKPLLREDPPERIGRKRGSRTEAEEMERLRKLLGEDDPPASRRY